MSELAKSLEESGYQLKMSLAYWGDEAADHRALPRMMTAREIVNHLEECYVACQKMVDGEKHEWGTYQMAEGSFKDQVETMLMVRDATIAKAANNPDLAMAFIVSHDLYHVGQLVSIRLDVEPEWNAYSIYRWEG